MKHLEQTIRREIPALSAGWVLELVRIVSMLVESFKPEHMYVFGSRARGDARRDSDVDLKGAAARTLTPYAVEFQYPGQ